MDDIDEAAGGEVNCCSTVLLGLHSSKKMSSNRYGRWQEDESIDGFES